MSKRHEHIARRIRRHSLRAIFRAGSGHPGGALSAADLLAYLYGEVLRHPPAGADPDEYDRFILSKGHACPALYGAGAEAGLLAEGDLEDLRKLGSRLQGHPHVLDLPWVHTSTGSLGQGFSAAVGMALALRHRGKKGRVFVMVGDGEVQEGMVWEGAMCAGHHRLGNLTAILDYNRMQSDDLNENVMGIEPLRAKWEAFRWRVMEIDGHDLRQMADAFVAAGRAGEPPLLIIAHTVKGKGVSFMEDSPLWHGSVKLKTEEVRRALLELGEGRDEVVRLCGEEGEEAAAAAPSGPTLIGTGGESLREAFGKALVQLAERYPDFVVLDADVAGGTGTHHFRRSHPHRFFQFGIAEQNMMAAAGGMAAVGLIPFVTTFAVFALRAYEQARLSVAYPRRNVKIVASHPGLDVGPDGASAQCLEDLAAFRALPELTVVSPADSRETVQATEAILLHPGPVYMRTGRSPARDVLPADYRFELGKGRVLRPGDDVTIFACGVEVGRALDAARILEGEGVGARVVNLSTIKPLDRELVASCARETGCVVTAEDHNVLGGLGSAVAEVLVGTFPCPQEFVGVQDRFGTSGEPEELAEAFGLTGPHIAAAARRAIERKRQGGRP